MSLPIVVHPAARLEYLEAITWYEAREVGVGAAFAGAIDEAMARLQPLPQHATETTVQRGPKVHRVLVRDFPYRIVAAGLPDVVLVVAYAHKSRRPGYWRGRLKDQE